MKRERDKNSASTFRLWFLWVTAKPLRPNPSLNNLKYFCTLPNKHASFFELPRKSCRTSKTETHYSEVHNSYPETPFCYINTLKEIKESNWKPNRPIHLSTRPQCSVAAYFRYLAQFKPRTKRVAHCRQSPKENSVTQRPALLPTWQILLVKFLIHFQFTHLKIDSQRMWQHLQAVDHSSGLIPAEASIRPHALLGANICASKAQARGGVHQTPAQLRQQPTCMAVAQYMEGLSVPATCADFA